MKKGVGVCFFAHPGAKGLRIAHITQDRQRRSPRQNGLYNKSVYRNVPNADASLPSACCDVKSLRSSWLTTTDVRKRLSHKIRSHA